MKFQMFGTLESDGLQREVMLCRDFDRPNEAMLHVYGNDAERPPFAVLVIVNQTSEREFEVVPKLVYRTLENGSLIPSDNQEDFRQAAEHRATLREVGDNLEGSWTNISGESGKIILTPPDASLKLQVKTCDSWNEFKILASSIRVDNKIELFRGHRDSRFVLKTSFHRAGLHRLERYCSETLVEFCNHVESILNVHIDLNNSSDYSMLFGLAQHHGLPTPLLDWTRSPYIAAFFAFSDALEAKQLEQGATHVRIYCLARDFVARRPSPENSRWVGGCSLTL
jgi:hypothetical protein